MVWGSNSGGDEIFCTHPDRPLWPTQPLVQWVLGVFPMVKQPECGVEYAPPTSMKVKERIELYVFLLRLRGLLSGELCCYIYLGTGGPFPLQ